jgi:hypothetical protein
MKGDSFLVAELQQTAMRAFIGFRTSEPQPRRVRYRRRLDAP